MKSEKKLIIIGAGETALLAYEYFTYDSEYEVVAFVINQEYIEEANIYDIPVEPLETFSQRYSTKEYYVFIAVGSVKLNRERQRLYTETKALGYKHASYISSKAFIWRNVKIGDNCFILENNTLQPFVEVGNNVTIWSGNHIGHRTVIRNNCFLSSHCVISGFCDIGENTFLGVNCTLENNVTIEKDNFIGAGALIRKDTTSENFYQKSQTELSKINTHKLFRIKK